MLGYKNLKQLFFPSPHPEPQVQFQPNCGTSEQATGLMKFNPLSCPPCDTEIDGRRGSQVRSASVPELKEASGQGKRLLLLGYWKALRNLNILQEKKKIFTFWTNAQE